MHILEGVANMPSPVKDPFSKEGFDRMHIYYNPHLKYSKQWSATVHFENGLTQGQQNVEADTWEELTQKLSSIFENL